MNYGAYKFQVLGYSPGQWWTVFAKYPPDPMDFRGIQQSRMLWAKNENGVPPESPVTKKFMHHWEKFVKNLRIEFGRSP